MARFVVFLLTIVALVCTISAKSDKVVCYYGSWAVYRQGYGKFPVESIDPFKCTHAIYSFVGINADASIRILDAWNEIDLGALRRFNDMKKKNPNLKTLIAIGGWNEGSSVFSLVAANPALRQTFADNALAFIKTHGFDGFDLDWEYPAQRGGAAADKRNVVLMVEALRKTFDATGKHYLVTAAVAASASSADISYDIPGFAANLDFINLMAYDFHGAFDGRTGHNAPLFTTDSLSVDAAVKAWIAGGAPAHKIVLGLAVYGRSFTVSNIGQLSVNNGLHIQATPGNRGPFTQEPGMMGYNEICLLKREGGWTDKWDNSQKVPFMYKDNQWISYDNERSIRLKAEYAVSMNLGGAMIWSVETEDVHGFCGKTFPILSTINEVFFGTSNSAPGGSGGSNPPTSPPVQTSTSTSTSKPTTAVTSTKTSTTTTTTTTTPKPSGDRSDCSVRAYIRDADDCTVYHYCANNVIVSTFKCPSGLVFNNALWACDWRYNVPECN